MSAHAHDACGCHAHHHPPVCDTRGFAAGIALNTLFVVAEAGMGWWGNSLALMADAGHNLGDVLALATAWGAAALARRNARHHRLPDTAALFNGALLLGATVWMAAEALPRITTPQPVAGGIVITTALAGIMINGLTAWLLCGGKNDLNRRGAFLHMAADAGVSAGVAAAGTAIMLGAPLWVDPALTLAIALMILVNTLDFIRQALKNIRN